MAACEAFLGVVERAVDLSSRQMVIEVLNAQKNALRGTEKNGQENFISRHFSLHFRG